MKLLCGTSGHLLPAAVVALVCLSMCCAASASGLGSGRAVLGNLRGGFVEGSAHALVPATDAGLGPDDDDTSSWTTYQIFQLLDYKVGTRVEDGLQSALAALVPSNVTILGPDVGLYPARTSNPDPNACNRSQYPGVATFLEKTQLLFSAALNTSFVALSQSGLQAAVGLQSLGQSIGATLLPWTTQGGNTSFLASSLSVLASVECQGALPNSTDALAFLAGVVSVTISGGQVLFAAGVSVNSGPFYSPFSVVTQGAVTCEGPNTGVQLACTFTDPTSDWTNTSLGSVGAAIEGWVLQCPTASVQLLGGAMVAGQAQVQPSCAFDAYEPFAVDYYVPPPPDNEERKDPRVAAALTAELCGKRCVTSGLHSAHDDPDAHVACLEECWHLHRPSMLDGKVHGA